MSIYSNTREKIFRKMIKIHLTQTELKTLLIEGRVTINQNVEIIAQVKPINVVKELLPILQNIKNLEKNIKDMHS